ncbi:flotillin family protein [Thermodesulfobacteriota bacterium]
MDGFIILGGVIALVAVSLLIMIAKWYKRCPSDHILVMYGKVGKERSCRCIHGGAQFVFPVIQDYQFLSLRPMQIDINLKGALSKQNIRINTPSTYTIGVSTEPEVMQNAAERLLSMSAKDIETTAREIIFGQQRLVIASMDIEEINSNRDLFLQNIKNNVESELNKIGLRLINVNITDITDEEAYLESLGKKAASEVTNRAKIEVSMQERIGESGKAKEDRDRRIAVSAAETEATTGEAEAEKGKRIAVARAEADAVEGEANAGKAKRIAVAQAEAAAVEGEAEAEKDQRIGVKSANAEAVKGVNLAAMEIAKSDAQKKEVEQESRRRAEVAQKQADAKILGAAYDAEKEMQIKRAVMVKEQEIAEKIVPAKIKKLEQEIYAEAQAEIARRKARGEADAIFSTMDAQARGQFEILKAKAEGFNKMIESCQGSTEAAALMLMIEKIETLVQAQVEAIKNLKIDSVVVWDGASNGQSTTANFVSGLASVLPPLHNIAKNVGIDLPEYLGKLNMDPQERFRQHQKDKHGGTEPSSVKQKPLRRKEPAPTVE